ncbi:MAG: DUF6157 family protein [Bacteroidota bacterium]
MSNHLHTTNYYNTFIEVAEDCPTETGTEPLIRRGKMTIANYQYNLIKAHPYVYTSDDIFFKVYAIRKDLTEAELESEREKYFSKGQACFRASPLTKKYGWGVHSNEDGKVSIYACESVEYQQFLENPDIKKIKAMRSKRK